MPDNGLFSLDGDVAVVIGGGGVLAGAMAEGLAQAGARIAVAGRTREHAEARARSIEGHGGQAIGIQCDATSKTDLQRALDTVLQRFGRVRSSEMHGDGNLFLPRVNRAGCYAAEVKPARADDGGVRSASHYKSRRLRAEVPEPCERQEFAFTRCE